MKFLLTKELGHTRLLTTLMAAVVFFILLYLGFDIALHAYVIGTDVHSVALTLFGDVENFVEPILLDTLLLQVHSDLFMSLFSLLILTSIGIRLHGSRPIMRWTVHLVFVLGMLSAVLMLAAYFVGAWLIPVWIAVFVAWHVLAFVLGVSVLKTLLFS